MGTPVFLLPLFAGLHHVGEALVWPGGFPAWHRRYRPELSRSITARNAIVLNAVLIAACMVLAGWGSTMSSGGFRHMLAHGAVGPRTAVGSLLLGASYQLWSMFHHRLRARA
ncbi:MAG: hypothetical protein KGJ63_06385 [Pseudomonadota bacterium]|jgi:predicted phage tail protein|nr:hypothetical protein [Pseudomonadota bacterium]